jgi:hypothetical protein
LDDHDEAVLLQGAELLGLDAEVAVVFDKLKGGFGFVHLATQTDEEEPRKKGKEGMNTLRAEEEEDKEKEGRQTTSLAPLKSSIADAGVRPSRKYSMQAFFRASTWSGIR